MKKIEIDFFIQLRNLIEKSNIYTGGKIIQIDVLNIICYEPDDFGSITKFVQDKDFVSIINYDLESNSSEFIEVIVVRDINNHFYFGCLIAPSELFSDKYLYIIYEIEKAAYDNLIKSQNHKGKYIYS
jgi:hypothetical protein